MREIQASEAKARLAQLLDDVERGEVVIITRHGRAIARLAPESNRRSAEIDKTVAGIQTRRRHARRITLRHLLSARDQGRKS